MQTRKTWNVGNLAVFKRERDTAGSEKPDPPSQICTMCSPLGSASYAARGGRAQKSWVSARAVPLAEEVKSWDKFRLGCLPASNFRPSRSAVLVAPASQGSWNMSSSLKTKSLGFECQMSV